MGAKNGVASQRLLFVFWDDTGTEGKESWGQKAYVQMLAQRQIDGIIFAASFVYSYNYELINPGFPIVYAYSHSPHDKKNSVLSDDVHAAEHFSQTRISSFS